MDIIRPTTITDAMFISSNLTENDEPEYAAGTTYGEGGRCIVISTHRIYESLKAANAGNNPPDNIAGDDPWWKLAGATNKWRAFDQVVGNQAEHETLLEYELEPGMINSISLQNVDAVDATITMTDPLEGEVYSATIDFVSTENINDWYDYFFEPILKKDAAVEWNLPPYAEATLNISISNGDYDVECGEIVVGMRRNIGKTLWSPKTGITDYSKKNTEDPLNHEIKELAFSKKVICDLRMKSSEMDNFMRLMSQYRATPLVWVAVDKYASMMVYGFYKDLQVELVYLLHAECSLEIEGLT
jgi:hypothetical protein